MKEIKLGNHKVEVYESVEDLPVVRFHKYQKLLLVDAGIGSTMNDFDKRLEKARCFMAAGKTEMANRELQNLRQCVYLIQSEISPHLLSFSALIKSIDGVACTEITDEGLSNTLAKLKDVPIGEITERLASVKKKIDAELSLYFPKAFEDTVSKEFYEKLRRRTLCLLDNIVKGMDAPDESNELRELTQALLIFSNPQNFTGSESAEITFDRQFENLCLMLSQQLHVNPKKYTVLEFYNAFEFLKDKAKEDRQALKRANKGR